MNKYFLFPFIIPLIAFFVKFFYGPIKQNDGKIENIEDVSEENTHTFAFLYQIINSTSMILGGLLYFVTVIRTKTENNANIEQGLLSKGLYLSASSQNKTNDNYKDILIIISMSILNSIYNLVKGYAYGYSILDCRIYLLYFFPLINIYIFKKQIYKHQKFALFIVFIAMIIIFALYFIYLDYEKYVYIYDILLFFGTILSALYLVLVKYMSEIKYYSIFYLLLLNGIISTIIIIVGYMIFSLISKGDLRYIINIFHCTNDMYVCFGNYYFNIIMFFILNAIFEILIFLVCYYFSPEVFAICNIISRYFIVIISIINNQIEDVIYIIFTSIGYFLIICSSLIYNEIIICHFWGLDKNTWKAIDKKAKEDYFEDQENDTFSIDGYIINNDDANDKNIRNTEFLES